MSIQYPDVLFKITVPYIIVLVIKYCITGQPFSGGYIADKQYFVVLYNDCSITKGEFKSLENTEFSRQK